MSQAYVSGMSLTEYSRVFGGEQTPLYYDEVVIDIGSGLSDLKGLAPEGTVVQVDPIYTGYNSDDHRVLVPGRIGTTDENSRHTLSVLEKIDADRVTIANTLRYLAINERATAIAQILRLSQHGIAQIYPVKSKVSEAIIEDAENLGFTVISQTISLGGFRQLAYKAGEINTTISILEQPKKAGPSDRRKLAQVIVSKL